VGKSKQAPGPADSRRVDELYGLEPVLDPAAGQPLGSEGTLLVTVSCPYCGESFDTVVDLSAGSSTYVEDCQVCCQPIEMRLSVDDAGNLERVEASRGD
jgi:hypothetical protein